MFCLYCSPAPSGFKAEGLAAPVIDIANAMRRRAAYDRRNEYSRAPVSHPEPLDVVIRNVRAVTLDPDLGEIARTDLHLRDGEIVALGSALAAAEIEIDGAGRTALPGLVAGHRHLWTEALGPIAADVAAAAEPREIYRVVRLALLERMSAGVTTLHACAIDIGERHAEAALLAQIDSGVRGRFSHPLSSSEASRRGLLQLRATWFSPPHEHLIELGLAGDAKAWPDNVELQTLPASDVHPVNASPRLPDAPDRPGRDPSVGSLAPGQHADLILVAGDAPWATRDPAALTADRIEMVCIDGRIRKRNGVLLEPNEGLIRGEAAEAIARIMGSAHMPPRTGSH